LRDLISTLLKFFNSTAVPYHFSRAIVGARKGQEDIKMTETNFLLMRPNHYY